MRNAFAQELERLAAKDERIVLLTGDIGNRMFNGFQEQFAERFFNCGVAEANMMSVAAGMALEGLRPVVYTIVPFVTTRCLEQIRVDVCYHEACVTIVGVGGGLSYASLGATHHSCEDIGFMRLLPGMAVVCPGDAHEVRGALRAALRHAGPVYLRLGKKGEPLVHSQPPELELGRGIVVRPGHQLWLISTGNLLPTAVDVAESLAAEGIQAGVASFPSVKPLDVQMLGEFFSQACLVATLEEHSLLGGLGGAVAEWLSDQRTTTARLVRLAAPDAFLHRVGSQAYAREQIGLDTASLVDRLREAYRELVDTPPNAQMRS
jgi:transketolase